MRRWIFVAIFAAVAMLALLPTTGQGRATGDLRSFSGPRDEPFYVDLHVFD